MCSQSTAPVIDLPVLVEAKDELKDALRVTLVNACARLTILLATDTAPHQAACHESETWLDRVYARRKVLPGPELHLHGGT